MGERGQWLLCVFMTLVTGEKPSCRESSVFRFFFFLSKELIPNVYFISNQHPFYVRWGDKICNYREAKLWLSSFSTLPCPQTRGLGSSSGQKSSSKERGRWKKCCMNTCCTHSLLLYPRVCPRSDSALRKRTNETVILKAKLSAKPILKNQLQPVRQATGQFPGFPHGVLSIQQPSGLSGAPGHLRESVKHGHGHLSNHGESDTKNMDRKSPQHKQFSGRERGWVIKAQLTCHTALKWHKTSAVDLRLLNNILAACVFHQRWPHQVLGPREKHSPEHRGTCPWSRRALLPCRRHLTSAPL